MTDLIELRHTLATHAETADGDLAPVERLSAVHARVREVRRRRRAAVVLAAVVVLGAGGLVWRTSALDALPARRPTVGGHTAPATTTSLGYGYRFETGRSGDGRATLALPASDEPRLVSWAGSSGAIRLSSDQGLYGTQATAVTPGSADFSDVVAVDAGVAQRFTVRGEGRVALAVYDLATRAPGVTRYGVTWRDDVAGGRLLSSATGATGSSSVSGTLTVPPVGIQVTVYAACAGGPPHSTVEFDVAGESTFYGASCDGASLGWDGAEAAGGSYGVDASAFGPPGATVTYTTRLVTSAGADYTPVAGGPGAQVAAGIYRDPPTTGRVGTSAVPSVLEQAGHTWRLQHVTTSPPGARSLTAGLEADAVPVLVREVTDHTRRGATTTFRIAGRVVSTSGHAQGGGGDQQNVAVLIDQSVSAEIQVSRAGAQTVLGVATYAQAD